MEEGENKNKNASPNNTYLDLIYFACAFVLVGIVVTH
jgi:hypothetical protein